MDDKDYTKASARWLFESNLLNNDYVKTALLANIYGASRFIKNVDILVDQNNKRMLIYIEVSFLGRVFLRKPIISRDVLEIIGDALPSYDLRVIYDYSLFTAAFELLKRMHTPKPKEEEEEEESLKEKAE